MKLIWLSYPMSTTAPRPPAIPAPSVSEFQSIEKDGANVQFLQCYNHTGTHLDTAAHVLPDGASIMEFAPEELVYTKLKVIDLTGTADDTVVTPELLAPWFPETSDAEALLVRFGVEVRRKNDHARFSNHCPGFSIPAAEYIHQKMPHLRMIGTDVPSIACIHCLEETMKAHNAFFEKASTPHFIIIEEMKLDVDLSNVRTMLVSPWLHEDMNCGPCVIWAQCES
ncbi:MAG: cyclase family protein [Candidatus Spyradocola sp.]